MRLPFILIVEDNPADVALMRRAIVAAEVAADIHVVYDGKAATDYFDAADAHTETPRPDLVVLDLNLPKKNGDDVLRHIRASARCRDAVVLIASSSDAPGDKSAVAALGIAGFFTKPSGLDAYMKLGPLVKQLLEGKESGPAATETGDNQPGVTEPRP